MQAITLQSMQRYSDKPNLPPNFDEMEDKLKIHYSRKYLFSYLPHTSYLLPLTSVLRNRLYLVISVKELISELRKANEDTRKANNDTRMELHKVNDNTRIELHKANDDTHMELHRATEKMGENYTLLAEKSAG